MKKIMTAVLIATALCATGCIGYHAQLRKEQAAEAQLNLACTNLINSLHALEQQEGTNGLQTQ